MCGGSAEDPSWSHFFSFKKTSFKVSTQNFPHHFTWYLLLRKFPVVFRPILIQKIMMCSLHWGYTFCTDVTLFALVLHLTCTALSQSESSIFSLYIISFSISISNDLTKGFIQFYIMKNSQCSGLVFSDSRQCWIKTTLKDFTMIGILTESAKKMKGIET